MAEHGSLSTIARRAVDEDGIPAVQTCVLHDGALVHGSAHGALSDGTPVDEQALFDVASVTKAAVTTTLTGVLVGQGALDLDALADHYLGAPAPAVTVRSLLAHGSGLPPWAPLFASADFPEGAGALRCLDTSTRHTRFAEARAHVIGAALRTAPDHSPGHRVYSDLGFITLGAIVERVGGARLDALFDEHVLEALELEGPRFFDLAEGVDSAQRIAPTGLTRPREPAPGQEALYTVPEQPVAERPGEVDDDNAWAMGGVAGHAGLFATAAQLARIGQGWLEEVHGANALGAGDALREFARPDTATRGLERGLGFDRPTGEGSSVGPDFGRAGPLGAIGHLGFTGCALWVDLDRRLVAALVSNRVRPGRAHVGAIRSLRPAFFHAASRAFSGLG